MANGRPTLLTPELQANAIKYARAGIPKAIIADAIGIRRSTLYNWLNWGDPEYAAPAGTHVPADRTIYEGFLDAFTQARAQPIILCEATWLTLVRGDKEAGIPPDGRLARDWLRIHEPSLYKEQADLNVEFGSHQAALDAWKDSILNMDRKASDDPAE